VSQIKAIILDVDGVIVGEKVGLNSPHPHLDVTAKLKSIQDSGIPISLCTAKPHFAIGKIIKNADLNNPHITDGGGVIINPLDNKIIEQNLLPSNTASELITDLIQANIYTEYYTVDDYFIQSSQAGDITNKHEHVIQSSPKQVQDLSKSALSKQITKIMPITIDEAQKPRVEKIFSKYHKKLVFSWGVHPVILPLQFGIVTAPGISKAHGAKVISQYHNIPLEQTLGVGDSLSDWQFVELCGYAAAMGNAKQDFKDLVLTKGLSGYIAPNVDDNGILEVFKHFKL
jgi:HAD superfamily hydrolase (TIGR01484 family)